jgi:hypothetical protein
MPTKIDQNDARKFVKALYKATDGRAMQWRTVIGLSTKQAAMDHTVEKGLLVEGGHSGCLTDKGAVLFRTKTAFPRTPVV